MKINGFPKSIPLVASLFVSIVGFALFLTFQINSHQTGQRLSPAEFYSSNDTIPIRKTNPQDSVFNVLLGLADKYFNEKNYEKCLTELLKAQQLKPQEQSLKDKITKLKGLVATQNEQAEANKKSMASGDTYFNSKDYLNAKSAYQLAVSQNPNDVEAREKLRKTLDLLRSQKAQNILFDVTVSSADKMFQAGNYAKAMQEYENAGKLLPSDPYPKNKINEIIKIQVDQQVKEEEYTKAIATADKYFLVKNYEDALLEYKKAAGIKADEKYPQDRIRELTGLIAAIKAKNDAYNKAIALADQSFKTIHYPDAIKSYQDALVIKPEQGYPKDKIKEIEGILARITNAQADYDKYIVLADSFYIDKKYFKARENYLMASSVKPSEAYPKEMVSKAEKMLTGQDAAMAKALEEQYAKTLAGADKLLVDKSYEPARAEYAKASNIKPSEQYPKDKLAEIDNIIANAIQDKEEQYKTAISYGDKAFADKIYSTARTEFQRALVIKPNETYPKGKLVEIEKQILADQNKQKSLETLYTGLIAKADKLLSNKSYTTAKTEYGNASALKPQETYPRDKITEIDKILTDNVALKALDDEYDAAIAAADKLLLSKTYDQAIPGYLKAGAIKPAERYPKDKIAEIEKILADASAKKSLEENYQGAIAKADTYFAEKIYESAKTEYANALILKPLEQYPKTKITETDAILTALTKQKVLDEEYVAAISRADKLLTEKSYDPALSEFQAALKLKPAEEYPKSMVREITQILAGLEKQKSLETQYIGAVAKADKLFTEKSFISARKEYLNASTLKPLETYPQEKINGIDKILADLSAAKVLDDKYAGVVANADKLLAGKAYEQARTEYQNAGSVKPAERYPSEKIAEIDKILADISASKSLDENYKANIASADRHLTEKNFDLAKIEYAKALELKPAEQYPRTKIDEIDTILAAIAKQKALEDEYALTIVSADKMLAEKSYEMAKTSYQKASTLKPVEQYPKTKLVEIGKVLADVALLQAIGAQYTTAIAGADKLLQTKTYDQAKIAYLEAGKIKPAEQYPKDKILEINDILASILKQKALDDQYNAALAKADQLLAAKTYDLAKQGYTNALNLKPAEQYPKDKITEIDGVFAELKVKEEAYKASLAAADLLLVQKKYEEALTAYQNALALKPQATYPKEKIGEINKALEELLGKQKYYENLVADADNFFQDKDYAKAKETYQQALGLFPAQPYPKERINLITSRVDSLYRANKSQYDKAIADGDRFYNSFEFDKAVDSYTDAADLLPMEKYPREMIVKIRRTISENAIADVLKTIVTITSNTEKQFSFPPVNIASRKNNFVYIKIKNLSGKPFNVLMRYGKDKQANGGVVMRNLNTDGKVNERLVSVRDQDLWSREDNNWISLYPQGGDVEVSFIQVSRAK